MSMPSRYETEISGSAMMAAMTEVHGRVWRQGRPQEDFSFDHVSDYLADDGTLVWVDVYDPDHATLT
ncbi:MAG: hypothetical protein JHC55_23200, partial [Mycolicibacterium sp.]|nr:hypothetical protein [Mycolicibacterium sp.]